MKISDEILKHLEIESFYIIQNDTYCMCIVLEVNLPVWKISLDTNELNTNENAKLKIKTQEESYQFNVELKKQETDDIYGFVYEAKLLEDVKESKIINSIIELESKVKTWHNRKEERYDIGTSEEKASLFGFKNLEQNLILGKCTLPCVINNVSYSGTKLTTLEGSFSVEKKVLLCLSFVNPIEQIHIVGIIRNCLIKNINDRTNISVLSLEFEDAPLSYKERVSKYINEIEVNNG